jgi:TRAP-type C4-dicarboxylate transport system permease small subunit
LAILEKIYRIAAILAGVFLFIISFLITIDVLVRWIYGKPFVGVFEVSEVVLLIATFLAAALVQHTGKQMRVEILVMRLKGKKRYLFDAWADLLGFIFIGLLCWEGIFEWVDAWQGNFLRRGMIEIPNTIHLGFLVVGSSLLALTFLTGLVVSLCRLCAHRETAKIESAS